MNWEALVAILGVGALLYFTVPGLRASIERSKDVESNWPAVVLPLVAIIVFVLLLISIARN